MKPNKVTFTPDEAGWFGRNVLKMLQNMDASERKNPGVKERSTYKVLNSMRQAALEANDTVVAFGEDELYEVDIFLTKKQRGMLKDLVGSVHKNLVEKVIPEYRNRLEHKITNTKINYQEYLDNAIAKSIGLERIFKKVR